MRRNAKKIWLLLFAIMLNGALASAQHRFPPPEFENGYQFPLTTTPSGRSPLLQNLDVAVLAGCLGLALFLIYRRRSRRGLFWLSLFSLAYFGFYRKGCICPIGSPQNIAYGLFHPDYAVPFTVMAFFALPLIVALFAGRAFCAGVCPQGALQDFFLIKPLKVPAGLENGLGMLPFLFLGAGIVYAATGTGFVICRYDPFVPLFRLSGGFFIIAAGVSFVVISMFVGRPYCRFLCPYGALLKLASAVSKWRVRVTPDYCTQCQLCQNSCPFGAMREPAVPVPIQNLGRERKRLGGLFLLLPVLVILGGLAGAALSPVAAQLHPTVALANLYARQQLHPVTYGVMTPEALALARADLQTKTLLATAADLRVRFRLATMIFGGWFGLVVGIKLISLSLSRSRTDFEPDRGSCFACARCFSSCPSERVRLGEIIPAALPATAPTALSASAR